LTWHDDLVAFVEQMKLRDQAAAAHARCVDIKAFWT
jgi:hypothetical protein